MNVNVTDISETRKKVTVTFSSEENDSEQSQVLSYFSREARVPGFRPGKAPARMIQQRYRKELQNELRRRLINKAWEHVIKEEKIDVAAAVEIDPLDEVPEGQDIDLNMTLDINPEFNLPEYKGIETKVPDDSVSEEEVKKAIDALRRQRAEFNIVERPAEKGDYVKVSYTGSIDGQKIAEIAPDERIYGTLANTWEEAGTEEDLAIAVPAVAQGVLGMKAGDKGEAEMDFPEDFKVEALAGKHAVYEMEVHEVRERKMPELDEDFFKSIHIKDKEELEKRTREELEHRKERERYELQREQVIDTLLGKVEFPLPESMMQEEEEDVFQRMVGDRLQRGASQEDLEKDVEDIRARARSNAAKRVKMNIMLNRIAKLEKVTVNDNDYQQLIINHAMATRQDPRKVLKELKKDDRELDAMTKSILMNKTLDLLIKEAKVTVESE